jgi:hypothetical protein
MMIAKRSSRVKDRYDMDRQDMAIAQSRSRIAGIDCTDELDLRLKWFYSLRQRVRRSLGQ